MCQISSDDSFCSADSFLSVDCKLSVPATTPPQDDDSTLDFITKDLSDAAATIAGLDLDNTFFSDASSDCDLTETSGQVGSLADADDAALFWPMLETDTKPDMSSNVVDWSAVAFDVADMPWMDDDCTLDALQEVKQETSSSDSEDGSNLFGLDAVKGVDVKREAPEVVHEDFGDSDGKPTAKRRKMKVDWTPELHARFVQVVEQLGAEKAMPSRIAELMGVPYLTRHNVASHLQKYRSHRRHMLARAAETASWQQPQQPQQQQHAPQQPLPPQQPQQRQQQHQPQHPPQHTWQPTRLAPIAPAPPHGMPRPIGHVWGIPVPATMQPMPSMPAPIMGQVVAPGWAPTMPAPVAPANTKWHPSQPPLAPRPQPLIPVTGQPAPMFGVACVQPMAVPMKGHMQPGFAPASTPFCSIGTPTASVREEVCAAIQEALRDPKKTLPLGLRPPNMEAVMAELQRHGNPVTSVNVAAA
eukprot:jgi/Chlat1/1618/Chrsp127S01876